MSQRISDTNMAEFVLCLLPEEEHDKIEKRIRNEPALSAHYGEWVNIAANTMSVQWDGPVPDVLPQIHDRLWGVKSKSRQTSRNIALLGGALVAVLLAKAWVVYNLWLLW